VLETGPNSGLDQAFTFWGDEAILASVKQPLLPSIMSLEMLCVTKTRPILDAIVVPNLEQFNYTSSYRGDLPSVALIGFKSKFTNVRQLSFSRSERLNSMFHGDVMRFCEAFTGVHHVKLDVEDWPYLFAPSPIGLVPGLNSHIRYPVDLWTELRSLTFNRLHSNWLIGGQLMAWLVHRRASSLQRLHMKVKDPIMVKLFKALTDVTFCYMNV